MTRPDIRIPVKKTNPTDHQQATYIADRTPRFKVHRTLGHAHAALLWRVYNRRITTDMALYTKVDDEGVVQHEWKRGEHIDHFPWQLASPTEAELRIIRTREDWHSLSSKITTFVDKLPPERRVSVSPAMRMFLNEMQRVLK